MPTLPPSSLLSSAAFSADEQGAIAAMTLTDTKNNVSHTGATAADASVQHRAIGPLHILGRTRRLNRPRVARGPVVVGHRIEHALAHQQRLAVLLGQLHPTDYAVSQGVYVGTASNADQPEGAAVWWLRSNGYYAGYASVGFPPAMLFLLLEHEGAASQPLPPKAP